MNVENKSSALYLDVKDFAHKKEIPLLFHNGERFRQFKLLITGNRGLILNAVSESDRPDIEFSPLRLLNCENGFVYQPCSAIGDTIKRVFPDYDPYPFDTEQRMPTQEEPETIILEKLLEDLKGKITKHEDFLNRVGERCGKINDKLDSLGLLDPATHTAINDVNSIVGTIKNSIEKKAFELPLWNLNAKVKEAALQHETKAITPPRYFINMCSLKDHFAFYPQNNEERLYLLKLLGVNRSGFDNKSPKGEVYCIKDCTNAIIKIGFSQNPTKRIADIQMNYPFEIKTLFLIGNVNMEFETVLHKKFKRYKLRGEWYHPEAEKLIYQPIKDYKESVSLSKVA